jgi:SAM-dependent methyltransferase
MPAEPAPSGGLAAAGPGDPVGAATLEQLAADAPRYNRWLTARIAPWVGRRVLEIGAGIGNMAEFFLDRERLVLAEPEASYRERLAARFAGQANVSVVPVRLPVLDPRLAGERFDTIICLNVLEHVEADAAALAAMRGIVAPGGRIVLLVPALRFLYGSLDSALGHYRRYTADELRARVRAAGLRLVHLEYFNLGGVPGWWLTGRVLRRTIIPRGSLRLYDALVPLFRLERWLPWRLGQSLIAVGEVGEGKA